jgi:putative transposase
MGTNRWTYNRAVASGLKQKKSLRAQCVTNELFEGDNNPLRWVLDTPYEVRDAAICDYIKARKSTMAQLKAKQIKRFKMRFRSKKDRQQSFVVRNRDYKQECDGQAFSMFRGVLKKAKVDSVFRARERLPAKIDYDARLVCTRLDEWYLCIPVYVDDMPSAVGDENQVPEQNTLNVNNNNNNNIQRVCSLDPGVRTFQTIYDATTGGMIEVGAGDFARFYRLCHQADQLQSRHDKTHGKKRYKLKRAQLRIFEKIRRLVKEIHCKLASFLVRNYSVVLLPSFDTSRMVVRDKRKLRSKTARSMLTWSHYRFKQRLLDKASKSGGRCTVLICTEEYTSKTCTRCGFIHTKLGGAKVFRCPQCALVVDRDYNGARNVLLKHASHFDLNVVQRGNVRTQGGVEATLLAISLQEVNMDEDSMHTNVCV